MMMTTKVTLITSADPKGQDAVAKFCAVYNKQQLVDGSAQRLNESSEFWKDLGVLIQKHSATNQYAKEVTSSNYTYPKEYKRLPIDEQVNAIALLLGLDPKPALEFAKTLGDLPEGAESWFAIPKVSAVAKKHFPAITDTTEQYCEAVNLVLKKLDDSRSFTNYRKGEIIPTKLRQHARTVDFLTQLEEQQAGDIIIIAAQYGMHHRGKSVRRARETFAGNEFGLGAFALGCMALVHPNRYVRWEELDTDCSGDEFAPGGDGAFSRAPVFCFVDGRLGFGAGGLSHVLGSDGSASAFVPQP